MEKVEIVFGDYLISTDKTKLNIAAIHDFLSNHSGWSNNIPIELMKKSIDNSLTFGLFTNGKQIGFARVTSDLATFAYLGDVYVLDDYRGQGLSKKLIDAIMAHPDLQGLRRWVLVTSTAPWLYEKYGFTSLAKPESYMERHVPDIYSI